jgi:hypothetical protein
MAPTGQPAPQGGCPAPPPSSRGSLPARSRAQPLHRLCAPLPRVRPRACFPRAVAHRSASTRHPPSPRRTPKPSPPARQLASLSPPPTGEPLPPVSPRLPSFPPPPPARPPRSRTPPARAHHGRPGQRSPPTASHPARAVRCAGLPCPAPAAPRVWCLRGCRRLGRPLSLIDSPTSLGPSPRVQTFPVANSVLGEAHPADRSARRPAANWPRLPLPGEPTGPWDRWSSFVVRAVPAPGAVRGFVRWLGRVAGRPAAPPPAGRPGPLPACPHSAWVPRAHAPKGPWVTTPPTGQPTTVDVRPDRPPGQPAHPPASNAPLQAPGAAGHDDGEVFQQI